MTKSLAQLNAQIEKLQRQAEALRAEEVAGVIARIREAIDHYGLTAADLGFGRAGGAAPKPRRRTGSPTKVRPKGLGARIAATPSAGKGRTGKRPGAKKPGVIRFRDQAGNTWTGHGKRPNWFKAALDAGKTPDDLAVTAG